MDHQQIWYCHRWYIWGYYQSFILRNFYLTLNQVIWNSKKSLTWYFQVPSQALQALNPLFLISFSTAVKRKCLRSKIDLYKLFSSIFLSVQVCVCACMCMSVSEITICGASMKPAVIMSSICCNISNHVFSDQMTIYNIINCVSQGNWYISSLFVKIRRVLNCKF